MHSKVISVPFSPSGLDELIKELKKYEKWVIEKTELLTRKLANLGLTKASIVISFARYNHDFVSGVTTEVIPIENGYKIVASGEPICFIEFGAGVHYNGAESYLGERPNGIVGIGQYGKGNGNRDFWWYEKANGEAEYTHGTQASMPMYYASKEMQENIEKIANEVFR